VKEIYNYTQDDLITEDVLLLDCQREIYVWVGLHSAVKSKQEALNLGQVPTYYAFTLIVMRAIKSVFYFTYIWSSSHCHSHFEFPPLTSMLLLLCLYKEVYASNILYKEVIVYASNS